MDSSVPWSGSAAESPAVCDLLGIDSTTVTLTRQGAPFAVDDTALGRCRVHPFLFDCDHRDRHGRAEWVSPTAIADRGTVSFLRESYDVRSRVDHEAATAAVSRLGTDVATLSRSGTVRQTLALADPETVLVAESRPGCEETAVADSLAERAADTTVTLTTDAGLPAALAATDVDTLVVGAGAVLTDGRVVNKVGTRSATLAAAHEGVDTLVVTASDKISSDTGQDTEEREPGELCQGDAPVRVWNPTFDVTPPAVVDTAVTERGALDTRDVEGIAAEHRALRDWTL